jgi:excinuclease UvrABC nuclease subunit
MNEIDELERRMDEAARALDFEQARRLRDRLNLIRGGASAGIIFAVTLSGHPTTPYGLDEA